MEASPGFEPGDNGFAIRGRTTWRRRPEESGVYGPISEGQAPQQRSRRGAGVGERRDAPVADEPLIQPTVGNRSAAAPAPPLPTTARLS